MLLRAASRPADAKAAAGVPPELMTPTAANWDPPVKTSRDMSWVWATLNPVATAKTPKAAPKTPTAKATTKPSRRRNGGVGSGGAGASVMAGRPSWSTVTYDEIDYRVQAGVATITLDRPEKLNALTAQMAMELLDAFDRIDEDDAVRAVIVTGRGRAFCAGADLSLGAQTFDYDSHDRHTAPPPHRRLRRSGESEEAAPLRSAASSTPKPTSTPRPSSTPTERRDGGGMITLRIFDLTKPIIAAINGPAVGVGITMTLAMDIRLAADDARMGFVFARRGIVPEAASSWFLPRLVGIDQALEWAYTGEVFPATEALAGGLVRSLHPADDLLLAAHEIADGIAANTSAVSVALTRQLMWRMLGASHPMEAHRADSRAINATGRSADALEGVTSFLEKRSPVFTGKVTEDLPDVFPEWEPPEFR